VDQRLSKYGVGTGIVLLLTRTPEF